MVLPPKKAREVVFLILYTQDIYREGLKNLEGMIRSELEISKKHYMNALDRVKKIEEYLSEIDIIIARISTSYDFSRIQSVEKNLLRLGAYEILYDADIPPKVAISESIRLAKKFSTPASCQFVNAILDNLYQESIGQSVDEGTIHSSSIALQDEEMRHADKKE
jgi:N utilization substance protein B